jgi:hypothetical protein
MREPLLKIEDENYELLGGEMRGVLNTLHCWAISAKRYALFNLDARGKPVIRKATVHGLGNLLIHKNTGDKSRDLTSADGSQPSQWYPLWYRIVQAGLAGHHPQVDLEELTILNGPALRQYTANNPTLLRWFKKRNDGRDYAKQIKPFNFFLMGRPKLDLAAISPDTTSPVAPYDTNLEKSLSQFYDREPNSMINPVELKTCHEALAQFHLHPENKFSNGDYLDNGVTERPYVIATWVDPIGKESNRIEFRF